MIRGRTPFRACGPFLLALSLVACREGTAPSSAENEQLDNAAEMLDAAPETLDSIDENALASDERNSVDQP